MTISLTREEKRAEAAQCFRAYQARTGMRSCQGCEIEMYCPSRMENWDGEKVEREAGERGGKEKDTTARALCNLLVLRGGMWILIPAGLNVKVQPYWRNCGKISIKSNMFVRIAQGYSRGAIVLKRLLYSPGVW